ncbi:MAG: hypothetical protein AAGA99_03955 [Actinomycetota bacterium]
MTLTPSPAAPPESDAIASDLDAARPEPETGTGSGSGGGNWLDRQIARARAAGPAGWISFAAVAMSMTLVWLVMSGTQLLEDSTTTGGDMGSHVWGPAFIRDHLLPDFRIAGWTNDWYAGFPVFRFYMVVPALAIVVLDVLLPYNVAFKLVSASGVIAMPLAAYAMGRLIGWKFPLPALMAVSTLPFLFDTNFTIYGGNLASTLAGEFAFSISLSLSLVYFGALYRGLATGKGRGLAAGLLALTGLCHLIPALFALVATLMALVVYSLPKRPTVVRSVLLALLVVAGAAWARSVAVGWSMAAQIAAGGVTVWIIVLLIGRDLLTRTGRSRWWWVASMGVVGGLLSAFWVLPFWWNSAYVNDMGWEKLVGNGFPQNEFVNNLFQPHETVDGGKIIVVFFALALVGALAAVWRWDRAAAAIALAGVAAAVAYVVIPQYRLWNARILPFWYLSVYLLAGYGLGFLIQQGRRAVEVGSVGWMTARTVMPPADDELAGDDGDLIVDEIDDEQPSATTEPPAPPDPVRVRRTGRGFVLGATAIAVLGLYIHAAQPVGLGLPGASASGASIGLPGIRTNDTSFLDDWARWNYRGLEGKDRYAEYEAVVSRMDAVGQEIGCGRAHWEYNRDVLGGYGTPMALMMLPHFTDGCIGSMEGLYFEASITVPFHFITQDELATEPSRPMRDIPYPNRVDVAQGVDHLQMMGVRYYMAVTDETVRQAVEEPDLELVAISGDWRIFEVANSEIVEGLDYEPAVSTALGEAGREWIDPAVEWFNDPAAWDVPLALDGPDSWQRVGAGEVPERRLQPEVNVTDIVQDTHSLSFTVDQIGVPVVVKVSYFPNWEVSGAEGPFRVTPNQMVVIPTSTEVTLSYGRTNVELAGWGLTFLGLVFLVRLVRTPMRLGATSGDHPVLSDEQLRTGNRVPDDPAGDDGRWTVGGGWQPTGPPTSTET